MFASKDTKLALFLLIFYIIKNVSLQSNNIDIFHYNANEKNSNKNIGEPGENLNVRECVSEKGYPTNTIKCRCNINYPNEIGLFSNKYGWWVRQDEVFNCTDVENTKTTKVGFALAKTSAVISSDNCYKPQERLEFFHSCLNTTYPRSATSCYCTYNYPLSVNLKCGSSGEWTIENYPEQCKGPRKSSDAKTEHVDLSNFGFENPTVKCAKPEELLNIFHSCEEKDYPASNTSCQCTYNPNSKIQFVCFNDIIKGLIWFRKDFETPCKCNLNPLFVHCYRNDENEIICHCRTNCFNLDIKANLSYSEINKICNDETTYLPDSGLKINYNNNKKSLGFKCTEGYELFGNKELTCNGGILNGTLPSCYKKYTTKKENNCIDNTAFDIVYKEVAYVLIYLNLVVSVIVLVAIIIFSIVYCLRNL